MASVVKNRIRAGRAGRLLLLFILLAGLLLPRAGAISYQYDENDRAIPAPDGYSCIRQVRSDQIGRGQRWSPTDIVVDKDGMVNVLDSDSGAVHIFSSDLDYQRTVEIQADLDEIYLMGLSGLCVTGSGEGKTYILADPQRERIIFVDAQGRITRAIGRPDTELIEPSLLFSPEKVQIDDNGNLYVLVSGLYSGACVFSAKDDYAFLTFIGGNQVEATWKVLTDYFWKQLLSQEQIASMDTYTPVPIANFTFDPYGQLYTVTNKTAAGTEFTDEIKKYNSRGVNILPHKDYGDLEIASISATNTDSSYVDLAVNAGGYIYALDANLCRVAVFDRTGNRLFTFGERQNTVGAFDTPVAIDVIGNDMYVLDGHYETISLFRPNEYGTLVYQAMDLYTAGLYEDAVPIWEEVRQYNSGFLLASTGIGMARMQAGDYEAAMDCFRQGCAREEYQNAFSRQRSIHMQAVFPVVFLALFALFVFLLVLERRMKIKSNYLVNPMHKSLAGKVRYTMVHPGEGGYVLARHTAARTTNLLALGILTVWFISSVLQWQYTGFAFNTNNLEQFSLFDQVSKTFLLFGLWILSSWFVSNLVNSSARLTDIIVVSAVAMIPYIVGIWASTLLTNVIVYNEAGFLNALEIVLLIWSAAILVSGLREIHELSFFRTLFTILLTLAGIVLILFMLLLLLSLFQQVIEFFSQVLSEFIKMVG